MRQTIKIYIVALILFSGLLALASGAHVSQAEALKVVQAMQGVK